MCRRRLLDTKQNSSRNYDNSKKQHKKPKSDTEFVNRINTFVKKEGEDDEWPD